MNRYVIEEFYRDPKLRRRLFEAAHRERALAIKAGLKAVADKLAALYTRVVAGLASRGAGGRWIEPLG